MVPYERYFEFYAQFANKKNSKGRFTLYPCTLIKYITIINDKINSSAYISARELKYFLFFFIYDRYLSTFTHNFIHV